jgi:hypothetical protein
VAWRKDFFERFFWRFFWLIRASPRRILQLQLDLQF